eukprot:8061902-Pyramimonas_sp.AAC.1
MQDSRSRAGLLCNVFKRRALDAQKSRSRSIYFRDSLGNRANARGPLTIHAGLGPPCRPPVGVYPPDQPVWFCHVFSVPSPALLINSVFHPSPSPFPSVFCSPVLEEAPITRGR